jgi:hypothetical protein
MKRHLHIIVCLALVISIGLGGAIALNRYERTIYETAGPQLPPPLPPVEDDPPNANGFPGYWTIAGGPQLPPPLPPVEDDPPNANGFPGYWMIAGGP